jgi:uncharacterized protein (TIGR03437 family)
VVPVGGHAADLALDEARGVLYVANLGGSRIDVVSLATHKPVNAIHVAPYPGSLTVSRDGRFLLVAHFGNFQAPSSSANALTLVDLASGARQTFALGDPPLGVAFGADGRALVVTTTQFLLFDPLSGAIQALDTIGGVAAKTLPVPPATFPPQIVAAAVGVSGDGYWIFGLTDTLRFRVDVLNRAVSSAGYTATPPQGPRVVSVSRDGSYFTAGWGLFDASGHLLSQFENPSGQLQVGGHAIDSVAGVIYAQIPQPQSQGAPGGLATVWGSQLSPVNIAASEVPVPTALGESCLTVNGMPVPMLFASPRQINAQLPFEVEGSATTVRHTPGGTSNNLNFTVLPTAPSVFRSGVAGPQTGIPLVMRAKNNKPVTTANPIHRGEAIIIYATGLGATLPPLATGSAAQAGTAMVAASQPDVSLGGLSLPLYFAGATPGSVGVYQIKALVPGWAPTGMQVPLSITQGSASSALTVRVID